MEETGLPKRPFFSCTPEELIIVDAEGAGSALRSGSVTPWMSFRRGPGNVIDTAPRRVASRRGDVVEVECEGGTVHIDFAEGRARKTTPQGQLVYMGGLEQRNDGLGYIPGS